MRVDNDIKSSRRCPCGKAKDLKKLSRVSTKSNDALTRQNNEKSKRHADTATRLVGMGRVLLALKLQNFCYLTRAQNFPN